MNQIHDNRSDFFSSLEATVEASEGKIDWYTKNTLQQLLEELYKYLSFCTLLYSEYQ
jgi:hypothetical protein